MRFSPVNAAFSSLRSPLQLHFDINKTVIISDPVSGITTEQMLNCILSECIWGTLKCDSKSDDGLHYHQKSDNRSLEDWTICSIQPSRSPPIENSITYGEFIDCYGPVCKLTRKNMKAMKARFTEKGMPGEKVSANFEQLKGFMRHSSTLNDESITIDECDESAHGQTDRKKLHKSSISDKETSLKLEENCLAPILDSGYYHILPSFFKLISYLHQTKCDFQIIFRTFGVDIQRVAEELNSYCEGNHPLFPLDDILPSQPVLSDEISRLNSVYDLRRTEVGRVKMDGTIGVDRRLHYPRHLGVMKRSSDTGDGITFEHTTSISNVETVHGLEGMRSVMHSWSMKQLSGMEENISSDSVNRDKTHDESLIDGVSAIQGEDERMFCGSPTAAIQDDFSYWNSQRESDHSGKLFLVNTDRVQLSTQSKDTISLTTDHGGSADVHSDSVLKSELSDSVPLQFFFDDNIERDRAHIVDVRDAKSFEKIPFSVSENVFVRKVEPYFAIINENYFIETLHEMIDAQTNYRHRP